jgi:hypothetical protein
MIVDCVAFVATLWPASLRVHLESGLGPPPTGSSGTVARTMRLGEANR